MKIFLLCIVGLVILKIIYSMWKNRKNNEFLSLDLSDKDNDARGKK